MSSEAKTHVSWSSRWTFIMAATGSAVGLGNIWKFPYIAGENGGGAFVLVYLLCIAIIGLPVLMAEILLGRTGRSNPITAILTLARESDASKLWCLLGAMGVLAGVLILSYYSVIAGWALEYTVSTATGTFEGQDKDFIGGAFAAFLGDTNKLIAWHSAFMALTLFVVAAGVTRGLGNAVRVLMPILCVLLVVLLIYSYSQGDFNAGLRFLFEPDFSKLTGASVLEAMGHAFFTLSIGMGAIMVYGSYMPENASITKTGATVVFLDTLIALVAGLAIFPLVFANGIEPSKGPGLMFVSLPIAFGNMDGGLIFGTIFFVLVGIAAWSSSISLIEPAVAYISENFPISRLWATGLLGLATWGLGLLTIYSNNWLEDKPADGVYFFETLDMLTAQYMLPLGGLLMAIFVGWKLKRKKAKTALNDLSYHQFNVWYATIRVFAPIGIIIVFAHSLGLF